MKGRVSPSKWAWCVLPLTALIATSGFQEAQPGDSTTEDKIGLVTDQLLQGGHRERPSTWPTYGGDWAQTRYSPLDEIRRENVDRLRPAWIAQSGIVGTFETTPIVLGREMYVTTPADQGLQKVTRLDAVTGELVWVSGARVGGAQPISSFRRPSSSQGLRPSPRGGRLRRPSLPGNTQRHPPRPRA